MIINITSFRDLCYPVQVHYSATKYALEALTKDCQELKPFGVVTAVAPGDIKTRFNDVTDWKMKGLPYREWAERCWRTIEENMARLRRRGSCGEVARLAEENPGLPAAGDFLSTSCRWSTVSSRAGCGRN